MAVCPCVCMCWPQVPVCTCGGQERVFGPLVLELLVAVSTGTGKLMKVFGKAVSVFSAEPSLQPQSPFSKLWSSYCGGKALAVLPHLHLSFALLQGLTV